MYCRCSARDRGDYEQKSDSQRSPGQNCHRYSGRRRQNRGEAMIVCPAGRDHSDRCVLIPTPGREHISSGPVSSGDYRSGSKLELEQNGSQSLTFLDGRLCLSRCISLRAGNKSDGTISHLISRLKSAISPSPRGRPAAAEHVGASDGAGPRLDVMRYANPHYPRVVFLRSRNKRGEGLDRQEARQCVTVPSGDSVKSVDLRVGGAVADGDLKGGIKRRAIIAAYRSVCRRIRPTMHVVWPDEPVKTILRSADGANVSGGKAKYPVRVVWTSRPALAATGPTVVVSG